MDFTLPIASLTPAPDRLFILTDSNVAPLIAGQLPTQGIWQEAEMIVMSAGEQHKNIVTLQEVWQRLSEGGATRRSLMLCIGGGVVTDLGGFAAATFKRGIRYANAATTLLGAVDAAVGGKTGIDFLGLKNEIGAFHSPVFTEVWSQLFSFLPRMEILSGYAEMVKCAMLSSRTMYLRLCDVDTACELIENPALLDADVHRCIDFKVRITTEDPYDTGLRRTLNLGHTAGHAFESLLLERGAPVAHGVAVAHGLLVTLILSRMLEESFDSTQLYHYADFLKALYPRLPLRCVDVDPLLRLCTHDKKNHSATPRFILLRRIGETATERDIDLPTLRAALETYLDLMGQ